MPLTPIDKKLIKAVEINMVLEDWFKLYSASMGTKVA